VHPARTEPTARFAGVSEAEALCWSAGFRWEGDVLAVLDEADLAADNRVTEGVRAQPRLGVQQEAIHRVRWSVHSPQAEVRISLHVPQVDGTARTWLVPACDVT